MMARPSAICAGGGAQQGIALVAVLWMLMLTGVIGASLIHLSQGERRSAVGEVNQVQARLLADGAIRRVIFGLVTPALGERWSFDGPARAVNLFDQTVSVRLESEAGKIDLGAAPVDKIAGLFRSLGLKDADADLLASRVKEWQLPADAGPDIAADPYRQDELRYGPRHAPFRSVDELRMVHGITDDIFHRMKQMVTIYSHLPNVDPYVASDDVLKALDEAGDALAHGRRLQRMADAGGRTEGMALTGVAVTVEAVAVKGDARVERRAVIRLAGNPDLPYLVLAWN